MKHCCKEMTDNLQDEDEILYFFKEFNEYLIPVHDGGSSGIVIRYCPWCGQRLPESAREKTFPKGKGLSKRKSQKEVPRRGRSGPKF